MSVLFRLFVLLLIAFLAGCDQTSVNNSEAGEGDDPPVPTSPQGGSKADIPKVTEAGLREAMGLKPDEGQFAFEEGRLVAVDLSSTSVTDLTPLKGQQLSAISVENTAVKDISILKGMPLVQLHLHRSKVTDISPLKGMSLDLLYLDETGVTDLSALSGMPLKQLYLNGTKVKDISAVKGMPLQYISLSETPIESDALSVLQSLKSLEIVWLTGTKVTDLTPLVKTSLISIDVSDSPVQDLKPLAKKANLQRLNIAGTKVRDLTPLKDLQLTRLLFSPKTTGQGIEHIRKMETIREIGTSFEEKMSPAQFWAKYDRGDYFLVSP